MIGAHRWLVICEAVAIAVAIAALGCSGATGLAGRADASRDVFSGADVPVGGGSTAPAGASGLGGVAAGGGFSGSTARGGAGGGEDADAGIAAIDGGLPGVAGRGGPAYDASASEPSSDSGAFDLPDELDAPETGLGACGFPPIVFELDADPGSAWLNWNAAPACWDGKNWLRIFDASGNQLGLITPCGFSCLLCPSNRWWCSGLCGLGSWVFPVTLSWDGIIYESSKCETGTACVNEQCASPGQYTARLCGESGFSYSAEETCFDVGFALPSSARVTATLPALPRED